MAFSPSKAAVPPPGAGAPLPALQTQRTANLDADLMEACQDFQPSDWEVPDTEGYDAIRQACLKEERTYLEVSLSHLWLGKQRLLAAGYHMICYRREAGKVVKVASKDWDDDVEVWGISSRAEARFEALRRSLARIVPIAASVGAPHLRIFTEDTVTSGVIRPIRGYRIPVSPRHRSITYAARKILVEYPGYPDRVFARGFRRDERNAQGKDGKASEFQMRFGHIRKRLRLLADPDGHLADTLWVDLVKVAELLDRAHPLGSRRPSFMQGLLYHLRDERRIPARVVSEMTGVPTGQVNRGAKSFKQRLDDAPELDPLTAGLG